MRNVIKKILRLALLKLRDLLDLPLRFREVSILCYHSVSDAFEDTTVSARTFESHLNFLIAHGYKFVSLEDILRWYHDRGTLPRKAVALTFDDGYADFATTVVPILRRYQIPVTIFVIGDGREVVANPLVGRGYHTHTHPNLENVHGDLLAAEVAPQAGEKYFAYPGGHYSAEAVEAVKHAGYEAAFSIKPDLVERRSDPYLLPRHVILKDMALWEVRFHVSKAAAWYRAIWRLV